MFKNDLKLIPGIVLTFIPAWLIQSVFIALFCTAIVFGYSHFTKSPNVFENIATSTVSTLHRDNFNQPTLYEAYLNDINRNEALGGYIFLTSAKKTTSTQSPWDSFVLDVANGSITKITSGDPTYFLSKFKTTDSYLYAGRPWKTDSQLGIYNDSILLTTFTETRSLPILEDPQGSYFTRLRLPRVSPDGESYVYSAQLWNTEPEKPSVADINSWKISVGTLGTKSTHFADGYGAAWVNNGKAIVYVKKDGVYIKEYTKGVDYSKVPEYKIIGEFQTITEENSYSPRNQIAVSPNGMYVAIQHLFRDPKMSNGSVDMYKITFGEKPFAQLVKRIALEGTEGSFWPIFSPEGRYLSFQTSNFKTGVDEKNAIKIYDFVTGQYIKEVDFSAYNFQSSFDTDWVSTISFRN